MRARAAAGAQWLAGGGSWPCLLQSPAPPTNPLRCPLLLLWFFSSGSILDAPPQNPRLTTACLPQMLPAQGDSVRCRPFYDQQSDSLLLTQILRCRLSLIWAAKIPFGFSCDFKAFDGWERNMKPSPPGLCAMATLAAAHKTDRCFRQGDNTQLVHKAGLYILYPPLA